MLWHETTWSANKPNYVLAPITKPSLFNPHKIPDYQETNQKEKKILTHQNANIILFIPSLTVIKHQVVNHHGKIVSHQKIPVTQIDSIRIIHIDTGMRSISSRKHKHSCSDHIENT
jgi:hypothetical protein